MRRLVFIGIGIALAAVLILPAAATLRQPEASPLPDPIQLRSKPGTPTFPEDARPVSGPSARDAESRRVPSDRGEGAKARARPAELAPVAAGPPPSSPPISPAPAAPKAPPPAPAGGADDSPTGSLELDDDVAPGDDKAAEGDDFPEDDGG